MVEKVKQAYNRSPLMFGMFSLGIGVITGAGLILIAV